MPYTLASSRTRRVFRQVNAAPDDEIVEDSEPEREKQRELERETRRERRDLRVKKKEPEVLGIIELSDSSCEAVPQRTKPNCVDPQSVIVISDDSDDSLVASTKGRNAAKGCASPRDPVSSQTSSLDSSSILPNVREILGLPPRSAAQAIALREIPSSQGSAETPPRTQTALGASTQTSESVAACIPTESEFDPEEEQLRPFSLARYAYVRPSRTPSRSALPSRSVSTSSVGSRAVSRSASVVSLPPEVVPSASTPIDVDEYSAKQSGKRGRKPHPPSRAFSSFSERELARLLQCVACNLAWTTRKSAAQKMKHVQSCARKAGLKDETIEILIRQELEKAPQETAAMKGRGKAKEPERQEPKTLLGEKIDDEVAGKRRRRVPVAGTVRELGETRESILERARYLLDDTTRFRARASIPKRGFEDKATETVPPLTQPFAESALAHRFQPAHTIFSQGLTQVYMPSSGRKAAQVPESPPKTQPFGESALATRFGAKSRSVLDDEMESSLHTFDADVNIDPFLLEEIKDDDEDAYDGFSAQVLPAKEKSIPVLATTMSNVNGSSSVHGPRSHSADSSKYGNHAFGQDVLQAQVAASRYSPELRSSAADRYTLEDAHEQWRDDAILHYDPNLEQDIPDRISFPLHLEESDIINASASQAITPVTGKAKTKTRSKRTTTRARQPTANSQLQNLPLAADDAIAKPPSTQSKPKSKSRKATALTEEQIHTRLRERILADTQLYLRILRYEPLPLEAFIQLVTGNLDSEEEAVKVTGPLKLQVRAFLDKQAIQFYDHEVGGPRTKRRRK